MQSRASFMRRQSFKKATTYLLVCVLILNAAVPAVHALESGNIISSSGVIGTPTWGDHTIIKTQNGAVIDWNKFDTSSAQSLRFKQYDGDALSSMSAVLNRIQSGGVPTHFDGSLYANGRVFVVNPAGLIFGAGSTVNVSQLVASGLNMSNDAYNAALRSESSKMVFAGGGGDVVNNGVISAENSVYLLGQNVVNNGAIRCPDGLVVMAAGETLRLGQPASNVIVSIGADLVAGIKNTVTNNGAIGKRSSPVTRLVLAAGDVFSQAIPNVGDFAAITTKDAEPTYVAATSSSKSYSSKQQYDASSSPKTPKETKAPTKTEPPADTTPPGTQPAPDPEPDPDDDTGTSVIDDGVDLALTNLQRLWQLASKLKYQTPEKPAKASVAKTAPLPAPIPDEPELQISGCPALTKWAAKELGIGRASPQISFANLPASAASIPPCDACADLKRVATVLRDYAGTHITALSNVVSEFASDGAPPSEEQEAAITVAIAAGAEGNAEYALAKEYLDALAEYVAILSSQMDFSAAESTELVMDNYIAPLAEGENAHIVTFLVSTLTSSGQL